MKKQKTVWRKNYTLIRAWLNGRYPAGKNQQGSLLFRKKILYSYGAHAPIACIYGGVVLITNEFYSRTTSQHKSTVYSAALIAGYEICNVDEILLPDSGKVQQRDFHYMNLRGMTERYRILREKNKRARINSYYDPMATIKNKIAWYIESFDVFLNNEMKQELHETNFGWRKLKSGLLEIAEIVEII